MGIEAKVRGRFWDGLPPELRGIRLLGNGHSLQIIVEGVQFDILVIIHGCRDFRLNFQGHKGDIFGLSVWTVIANKIYFGPLEPSWHLLYGFTATATLNHIKLFRVPLRIAERFGGG
jgi:hypothetical protein